MKKLVKLLAAVALVAGMTGCESLGLKNIKMDTAEANERIAERVAEYIDLDEYKPIEISWAEGEELSNNLGYMYVDMVGKDGVVYSQAFKVGGDNQGPSADMEASKFHSKTLDFETITGLTVADIDSELLLKHYEDAKSQVPEEYNIEGIGRYTLEIDPKNGEKEYKFVVQVTEKGKSTSTRGRTVVTTYYKVDFEGQADGTTVMED